jgi:hypothetical protein
MDERKARCGGHFAALDLFRREYAIALSDPYLDPDLAPRDRMRKADDLADEYRRCLAQEMEAVSAQREADTSTEKG